MVEMDVGDDVNIGEGFGVVVNGILLLDVGLVSAGILVCTGYETTVFIVGVSLELQPEEETATMMTIRIERYILIFIIDFLFVDL